MATADREIVFSTVDDANHVAAFSALFKGVVGRAQLLEHMVASPGGSAWSPFRSLLRQEG